MDKKEGIYLRQSINQIIFAAILLFVGIFLLLLNVGVISLEIKDVIVENYPFGFLFISFWYLIRAFKRNKKGSLLLWFFLMAYSLMLSLDRLNWIVFLPKDFWRLWPVLFIYYGLILLVRKDKVKIFFNPETPPTSVYENEESPSLQYSPNSNHSNTGDKLKKSFSIGDVSYKNSNWSLEPMNLYNTIGDYFIDFRKAYIPEKETPILVHGWIGDVKMIVPDDVAVKIQAKVKIGDIRVFEMKTNDINRELVYKTPDYEEAIRKLDITIELKIGSIRIDKV
jgi:lia operon protein LiaF